ncbi:MAG: acyl-CoA dehydrogenase family protein, partial [Pseudomonadota bacterium]
MPNILRRDDIAFLLYDVLDIERFSAHPHFAEGSRAVYDQILDTAERMAEEVFQPFAAKLDANEPSFDGTSVHIIPEVKKAVSAFAEAGFIGASFKAEDGGMQLPFTITEAVSAWFAAANWSAANYPALTVAAANLLATHGSAAQKERFLPAMLEGRYFGTMCLSEPHVGSSLGDMRTRAEPQDDGAYRLYGNKMWISGGEHELSENIIHFVLAKIPGGPPGVKGISLFIVPRILGAEEGRDGEKNDIALASLNHKMGCRGTVNCALTFGEKDGAVGYLVGEPHKGLSYMFLMMNEMRIGVGMAAAALAYTGYLHALDYAKDRRQGRALTNRDPESPMVPIVEHADVKRMLLQQKAYAEGALAMTFYCASLVDEMAVGTPEQRRRAHLLLELLTPIAKSWPSEFGLRANETAIQVLGGAGYTRDWPLERFYRDNRLNPIHEGTKGVQGMDLLGRKVAMENGAAFRALGEEIRTTIAAKPRLPEQEAALGEALALAEIDARIGQERLRPGRGRGVDHSHG